MRSSGLENLQSNLHQDNEGASQHARDNQFNEKDLAANGARSFFYLGWLMGLEPTTTGITILDSTN